MFNNEDFHKNILSIIDNIFFLFCQESQAILIHYKAKIATAIYDVTLLLFPENFASTSTNRHIHVQ